jgi:hypothetical protein
MAVQEDVFKIPENVAISTKNTVENIPAEKQASSEHSQSNMTANFKSVEQSQQPETLMNESSSTPTKKKRSLKAQTKK